jgi:hypothetical protein
MTPSAVLSAADSSGEERARDGLRQTEIVPAVNGGPWGRFGGFASGQLRVQDRDVVASGDERRADNRAQLNAFRFHP